MNILPIAPARYRTQSPRGTFPNLGWLVAALFLAISQPFGLKAQDGPQPGSLDQLLGPIALYPDPLVALILPASSLPSDIAAAANYVQANGDPAQIGFQPWDNSVKGLAHYPQVVEWMAQNLTWTQAVGAAFVNDPGAVLQAVQRLRAEARASGALVDTPQQQVFVDGSGKIEILPAQPQVMYVPQYDPAIVYVSGRYDFGGAQYITFGNPYPVGVWLTFGFDWRGGGIWVGDWNTWHGDGGWRHAEFNGGYREGSGHRWGFPADRPRPQFRSFAQPRPYAASAGYRGGPPGVHADFAGGRPAAGPHGGEIPGAKKPPAKKKPASGEKSDDRDRDKGH
jgi:hypothetical protein